MILTSNTTLRAAGADDAAPLAGLKLAAFRETFIEGFAKVGEYQFPVGAWRDDEFIFRRP